VGFAGTSWVSGYCANPPVLVITFGFFFLGKGAQFGPYHEKRQEMLALQPNELLVPLFCGIARAADATRHLFFFSHQRPCAVTHIGLVGAVSCAATGKLLFTLPGNPCSEPVTLYMAPGGSGVKPLVWRAMRVRAQTELQQTKTLPRQG